MSGPYLCSGCGGPVFGLHKPCDCVTRVAFRIDDPQRIVTYRKADVAAYVEKHGEPASMEEALERLAALATTPAAPRVGKMEADLAELRGALNKAAHRFDYCAQMIDRGFNISGTLRLEHVEKAKHFALEARSTLSQIEGSGM